MFQDILARYRVTSDQVDRVHRVEDLQKHKIFYQCESAHEADVVYIVQFNPVRKRIECTCPAGVEGIPCWHARASLAAEAERRQLRAMEQERTMQEMEQERRAS